MLCKKPFSQGLLMYGCGQCLPCRINRRRLWTHRLMLESLKHPTSCFVTLTYEDAQLPKGGTLVIPHYQKWLKRLRKKISPRKIRFYLVGEYGDASERPHYHAALYGLGIQDTEVIASTWKMGFVYVGDLTKDSAQYIVGYVTKKMTRFDDVRLKGRFPEFARMSNKPGIGASAMDDVANILTGDHGCDLVARTGDVPLALNHGGVSFPLGRYLRGKLRAKVGDPEVIKKESFERFSMQMREMWRGYADLEESSGRSREQLFVEERNQKVLNLESRSRLFSSKKGKI